MNSEFSIGPGNIIEVFTENETQMFENKWLDTFCGKKRTGNLKSYMWHIFCGEKYPCISGEQAMDIYLKQKAPEFIVLSNEDEMAVSTELPPESCNLLDYYIFPKNMAWTMAITHEDGWAGGPYFAKHKNYNSLNQKNIYQIQKNRELKIAKNKGWL